MIMTTKDFKFELKETWDDTGTFTGMLSVYGVVDLGNDMVEPGAFTKTIAEKSGKVPMLWQHKTDEPIGELELTDTQQGLAVKGTFNLDLQRARDAYSLTKKGIIKGLSIGYRAVKKKTEDGVRHLKEIELFEGSVVTFPMLPQAQISTVKGMQAKDDFLTELAEAQTWAAHCMMLGALDESLCETRWDSDLSSDEKTQAVSDSIDQFKAAYLAYVPQYLALISDVYGMNGTKPPDAKAGRRISADTRTQIEEAVSRLQALLGDDAASTSTDGTEAAGTQPPEAATASSEPGEAHSMLETFRKQLKALSLNN